MLIQITCIYNKLVIKQKSVESFYEAVNSISTCTCLYISWYYRSIIYMRTVCTHALLVLVGRLWYSSIIEVWIQFVFTLFITTFLPFEKFSSKWAVGSGYFYQNFILLKHSESWYLHVLLDILKRVDFFVGLLFGQCLKWIPKKKSYFMLWIHQFNERTGPHNLWYEWLHRGVDWKINSQN